MRIFALNADILCTERGLWYLARTGRLEGSHAQPEKFPTKFGLGALRSSGFERLVQTAGRRSAGSCIADGDIGAQIAGQF